MSLLAPQCGFELERLDASKKVVHATTVHNFKWTVVFMGTILFPLHFFLNRSILLHSCVVLIFLFPVAFVCFVSVHREAKNI